MRKSNVKKIILIMALVIIAVLLVSKVYATGTVVNPVQVPISTNTTNTPSADTNTNTANTTNTNTNTNTTTIAPTTPTNTTSSTYTNTNLPQTGDASDYAIFLLIVVSVVVAIFAYKKVRDYNI